MAIIDKQICVHVFYIFINMVTFNLNYVHTNVTVKIYQHFLYSPETEKQMRREINQV